MKIIHQIPPPQPKNKFVALDIELFGLNPKQLHRPTSGEFACLSVATDQETVYVITDKLDLPVVFSNLQDAVWTIQHAKFDLTHLRRWANIEPRKKLWDTMLIERIMWGGYFDFFALEELARRYLDIQMDKSLQKSFEKATELSEKQIEYAAMDASITLQIAIEQRKVIRKEDFNIWAKVDRPALWAYMDFMGFAINVEAWKALAERNEKRAKDIAEKLPFNPRSPQQVKKHLTKSGFKRLPNSKEETLLRFIRKFPDTEARDLAERTLESRKYYTRASRYGMNLIKHHVEGDTQFGVDMIYCDYNVVGAETGRTSSSDPNMQNIPVRDTNEFRECFIARPDNLLLIADYSQQEAAILAHLAQDQKMIDIINSGENIYIGTGKEVFGKEVSKGSKQYKRMKSTVLGTNYGMSGYGLAQREDISVDDADRLINKYLRTFPDVGTWVIRQKKKKNYVETVMGRRNWLNRYSHQCEKNALNSPIQGTAADITKIAVSRLHQNWNYPYPFAVVATIHDEIVLDVPKNHAQEISGFVKETMEGAAREVCPSVKIGVDIEMGSNWGAKQ